MDDRENSFGFGLEYAGTLFYCEVFMIESAYAVYFNGTLVGTVEYTDSFTWIQASGRMFPQEIVDEIGNRIENGFS